MAERQETSVMVSIQEILRDAQSREEEEKAEAERRARDEEQRRLDDVRRRQEAEAAQLRAVEEERERKVFEEQRRQTELAAVQQAAVQRARMEAESNARLAEMTARQDHERQLHAMSHDKHKRRLQVFLVSLGILLFGGLIGGGVMIKNAMDRANAAQAQARDLQDKIDQAEAQSQKLQRELANTKDPEQIAALQKQLEDVKSKQKEYTQQAPQVKRSAGGGAPAAKPAGEKPSGGSGKPCNCTPGDPLCSCL
jgi:colicin import membrane protein